MAEEIAALFARIGADTSSFERAMGKVDSRMGSIGGALGTFAKVGVGAAVAGVTAVAGGLAYATKVGMEFGHTMSGAAAVLGATSEEMGQLNDLALRLGKETAFSASEAASAIEILGAQGLSVTQILGGAADAAVNLAAATGTDLVTASTVVTDAMAQFGLTTEDLSRAIDGISGVTVASKFDINDYALAIAQAGGVAGQVGVSFEDFNTVIAATSSSFNSGSDAGTSFKTFLQRLPGISGPAIEALATLGIVTEDGSNAFFDAQGNMKSMADIADVLQRSLVGLSDKAKLDLLTTAFGTDAVRTALALGEQGASGLNQFADAIGNVDAALQATTRLDNLAGDVEQASGSIETLGIKIQQAFDPLQRRAVQFFTGEINKLLDLDYTKIVAGVERFMGFFTSPGVSRIVGNLVTSFRNLGGQLLRLTGPLREVFGSLFNQLAIGDVNFGQVAADLGRALGQISDEVLRWIRSDALPAITQRLSEWGGAFVGWVVDIWPALSARLVELGGDILDWAASIWPGVSAKLGELGRGILNWISSQDWGQYLSSWWSAFTGWAAGLWEAVQPNLAMLWGNLVAWVQSSNLGEMVMAGWTWFVDWAGGLWTGVSAYLVGLWDSLVSWVQGSSLFDTLMSAWTWFTDWAGGLWSGTDGLGTKLGALWDAVVDWADGQSLTATIAKGWTWLVDWASGLWSDILPKITVMWGKLIAWASTVDLGRTIASTWNWLVDWAGKVWGFVGPKLETMWENLVTWASDVDLKTAAIDAWTWFVDWATNLWVTMKPGFDAMYTSLIAWMDEQKPGLGQKVDEWAAILGGLPGKAQSLWEAGFNLLQPIIDARLGDIARAWDNFMRDWNSLMKTMFGEDGKGGDWKKFWEGSDYVIGATVDNILGSISAFIRTMGALAVTFDVMIQYINGAISLSEALIRLGRAWQDAMSHPPSQGPGPPPNWGLPQGGPGVGWVPSIAPTSATVEININGSGADLPADRAKLQDLARAIWREAELSGMRLQ